MTFHSACVRILRREARRFGYPSSFSIYDQADSQRLMALTCRELELDAKQYPPKAMAAQVSNLKNELIDYETFASRARTARDKALAEAYGEYQRRLVAAGAMDFDDLIMVTVDLFRPPRGAGTTGAGSGTCSWTSTRTPTTRSRPGLRTRPGGAPFFSGPERSGPASPRRPASAFRAVRGRRRGPVRLRVPRRDHRDVAEFEQDYPDAKRMILLGQNYRSTQNILAAANAVV